MQPRGAGFPAAGAKKATAEAPTHYDRLILLNGRAMSSSGPLVSQPQDRILHQLMTLYPYISAADPFRRLVNAFLTLHCNQFDASTSQWPMEKHETWALLEISRHRTREFETQGSIVSISQVSQPLGLQYMSQASINLDDLYSIIINLRAEAFIYPPKAQSPISV